MDGLAVRPGGTYLDATVGLGGHSREILRRSSPDGKLYGTDQDAAALNAAKEALSEFSARLELAQSNFSLFDNALPGLAPGALDGALADLGVSSLQLDTPERGFSFQSEGPLDMRMDPSQGETALDLLQRVSPGELEACLREGGEERFARKLSRVLTDRAAEFRTTADLAQAVARCVPRRGKSHPATRVFLALRMAVNREMENLKVFLEKAPAYLKPGGRLVVISFHSTEDRIAKWFYRAEDWKEKMRPVIKSPLEADDEEQRINPRSRSAKMRIFEKI